MDFHSLSRRELQSLCMSNGIKANMTNLAMADALKSLQTVEGISETPRKPEPKTELQKAGRRAASSRQVGSARPHEPQGSPLPRSRRVTARFGSELLNLAADADADTDEGKDKEWIPETPKAPTTRRRAQGKKEEVVESAIPKTTTTKRRATKKEEEKTVGVTTRRRTRKTEKEEAVDLDVAISIGGKSALKMADLGKDVVEEKGSGSGTQEKEEKDIAQVLPIERSKEEGEEKDVIENVLSNDSSTEEEEETIRVEEKEEKVEQPEEDQICHEQEHQISFSEEEIDSKKEENHAEEEEQDDEEREEVSSVENSGNNDIHYQQEKLESSNDGPAAASQDPTFPSSSQQESPLGDSAIQMGNLRFLRNNEESVAGKTWRLAKLLGVTGCEADEESSNEEEEDMDDVGTVGFGNEVTSEIPVGNGNLLLEVGTVDFGSEVAEKFDLLPLSVSDNNKENHTGGDGRQKKIDPTTAMSMRKLKAHLKESLIKKKVMDEKRSALKPLEENLLPSNY